MRVLDVAKLFEALPSAAAWRRLRAPLASRRRVPPPANAAEQEWGRARPKSGLLHGSYCGRRRADGARQPQWGGGQKETRTVVRTQPIGEIGEVPDLAEIDAELEEAMCMQRQ